MENKIKYRVLRCAQVYLENKSTVREVAKVVGCSKSTVHNDLTIRLPKINQTTYVQVMKLLLHNKEIRHIRGGEATKQKYKKENAFILSFPLD